MKKLIVLFSLCVLFTSCVFINNDNNSAGGNNDNPPVTTEKGTAHFVNKSKYAVNIYIGMSPYYEPDVTCTVPASGMFDYSMSASVDSALGDVFYFEYLIEIGNSIFPYWVMEASNGYKTAIIKKNQKTEIVIDELKECKSTSAYLLIENNTTSGIRVNNGTSPLKPYKSSDGIIKANGGSGVYEVKKLKINEPADINLGYLDSVKIKIDVTNEISLTDVVTNSQVESGSIYTISVNTDEHGNSTASLKAVTPFNIDTQKKIWSVDEKYFSSKYPICMRPSYDGKKTWVMGTATTEVQKVGFISIDEYGNYLFDADYFLAFSNSKDLVNTTVVDFLEEKDGSIVMLCRQEFRDYETFVLTNYNCSTKTLKWSKVFGNMSYGNNTFATLNFRNDSKNKLLKLGENKYAFVGIYDFYQIDNDNYLISDEYKYLIAYIDASDKNSVKIVENISADSTDLLNGIERALTSAYFDGTDLYVCGYDNWSPSDYSTTHVGKIWKASLAELEAGTFDFNSNVIYSKDNCLFFSIDGTNGNTKNSFVACGEYTDTGKILKGFYVTSSMIKNNASATPVLYTVSGKSYCWFNQLCQYENKIVLCGKAANSFDGTNAPLPFVVAYDYNGNKLWENLSFVKYSDAMNILSNTIGTYMLQLGNSENKIHYVNADLLGKEVIVK